MRIHPLSLSVAFAVASSSAFAAAPQFQVGTDLSPVEIDFAFPEIHTLYRDQAGDVAGHSFLYDHGGLLPDAERTDLPGARAVYAVDGHRLRVQTADVGAEIVVDQRNEAGDWVMAQQIPMPEAADGLGAAAARWGEELILAESHADGARLWILRPQATGWAVADRVDLADLAVAAKDIGALAVHHDRLVVGLPTQGKVVWLTRADHGWQVDRELASPNRGQKDGFGAALAVAGSRLVVGAPAADLAGKTDAGAVYRVDAADQAQLWQAGQADAEQVGRHVAADGRFVAVESAVGTAVWKGRSHRVGEFPGAWAARLSHGHLAYFDAAQGGVRVEPLVAGEGAASEAKASVARSLASQLAVDTQAPTGEVARKYLWPSTVYTSLAQTYSADLYAPKIGASVTKSVPLATVVPSGTTSLSGFSFVVTNPQAGVTVALYVAPSASNNWTATFRVTNSGAATPQVPQVRLNWTANVARTTTQVLTSGNPNASPTANCPQTWQCLTSAPATVNGVNVTAAMAAAYAPLYPGASSSCVTARLWRQCAGTALSQTAVSYAATLPAGTQVITNFTWTVSNPQTGVSITMTQAPSLANGWVARYAVNRTNWSTIPAAPWIQAQYLAIY